MDLERVNSEQSALEAHLCTHCAQAIAPNEIIINQNQQAFCCHGCMSVHTLLLSNNLQDFYKYQESGINLRDRKATTKTNEKYAYMDSEAFIKEFTTLENGKLKIHFLLEGIHCMACVWLIERIPHLENFVTQASFNMGTNLASFTIDTGLEYSVSKLATTLDMLGYTPHPYDINSGKEGRLSNRKDILQIGVAASAMSNIMIYAISNYAGATKEYAQVFDAISLALCLPVILYSARPIYKSCISAFKLKTTSVDIPLAIAIVFGFILSTINFAKGTGPVYFDSITTLIFLILLSRYFVKMLTQKSMSTKGISSLFFNTGIKRIDEKGGAKQVYSSEIKLGDSIECSEDERIIFDCTLLSDSALILNTINTGESTPIVMHKGERIDAGAICIEDGIRLKVEEIGMKTKLGRNLAAIESNSISKNPATAWAQTISKFFTISILGLSAIVLIMGFIQGNITQAFESVLAILIVGCPCAFAIATPIVIATRINKLKSLGIFVKNEASLEELNNTQNIIFDKTGTLTKGNFEVISFKKFGDNNEASLLAIAYALESGVQHPIAFAIKKYAKDKLKGDTNVLAHDKAFIAGSGVGAIINNKKYFIGKTQNNKQQVGLYEEVGNNKELLALFRIEDSIREESKSLVNFLRNLAINIHLSTGDNSSKAIETAKELGIPDSQIHIEQNPHQKLELAKKLNNTTFIGDGDNDALAMVKANVSIAIGSRADIAMRSCDIYLANDDIGLIAPLFRVARDVRKTLRRNITFAITYNIIGIGLALFHIITPLYAAILMPISSVTVLLSSLIPMLGLEKRILNLKEKS